MREWAEFAIGACMASVAVIPRFRGVTRVKGLRDDIRQDNYLLSGVRFTAIHASIDYLYTCNVT